jgi:23S rRNA (adenine2503-C2)-methyltransferase
MAPEKELIHDLTFKELEDRLVSMGEPAYRAAQIWTALYKQFIVDVNEISSLPKALRAELTQAFSFQALTPVRSIQSKNGQTTKTLFSLHDGALIETVLMMYNDRRTICISTQAGCGLGCLFCATGQMGLTRNLTSGEITAQVLYFAKYLAAMDDRVTNVVMMGMGEPFQNYESVMTAVEQLNDPEAYGLGARRITISTVGLVPEIKRFADADTQVNLAISLHSVDDDLRTQMIPINNKYPVASILDACRYYVKKTNRRITFEYALIDGVNDSPDDAAALARHLIGLLCHVNLIPLNPTKQYDRPGSPSERVSAFCNKLESFKIPCTIRLRRGLEIKAGCGQLAAEGDTRG